MNQQTEIAIAIENARRKLLRLISYWLFVANLLSAARHEILPRRVSALAATILNKLELTTFLLINAYATYYLKTDCLHLRRITAFEIKPDSDFAHTKKLKLKPIIARLKALEKSLQDLPAAARQLNESYAPRRTSNFDAEASCQSKIQRPGASKKARNFHPNINSQSRAPPSLNDFKTAPNKQIYQLTSCDGSFGGNARTSNQRLQSAGRFPAANQLKVRPANTSA
ncbi:MAG: hypothetical protein U5K75_07140 [Ahrensia sp.]|nr:hypothetical protein [Ahrensia sp.]